jgi:hypothetical protein
MLTMRSTEPSHAAYGWPENIAIEDALALLFSLNLERAKAKASL